MNDVTLDQLARWLERFGVPGAHGDTVDELFKSAGMSAVSSVGPVYGSLLLRFGMTAGAVTTLSPAAFAEALRGGLEGVVARGDSALADELAAAVAAFAAAVDGGAEAAAAASTAGDSALFAALARALADTRQLEVVNPGGLHARPAALIADEITALDAVVTMQNLRTAAPPVTITGPMSILLLAALQGDRVLATATGADARAALDALERLVLGGFGENLEPTPIRPAATGPIGVSAGRAVAPAVHMPPPLREPDARESDPAVEAERIAAATVAVADELRERAARVEGEAREILEAEAAMATDVSLIDSAVQRAAQGAERAVWVAVSEFASVLDAQGDAMAERVSDLHDLRTRLVAHLLGRPAPGVPRRSEPFVLIAHDLSPADTVQLDSTTCVALVTERGGPTSHTAILARSMGIPAIVAAAGALEIAEGTIVLVDGSTGELRQNPSDAQIAAAASPAAQPAFGGSGATKDGLAIQLLANVGSPESVAAAVEAKAEGIGLLRTEFCFIGRETAPSVDEQVAAYRPIFAAFAGRSVIVRTLDAGGDKPLAFVADAYGDDSALGIRGIRTMLRFPAVLDDQLRAIALAAAAEQAVVSVMAPMIATVSETDEFVAACARHGLAHVGVMIETPAAALLATEITRRVSFTSVGTNDLTQYTMAADRQIGDLAALNDPWQPAVLRLIRMVASAGVAESRPVGVCGEAASDPMLAAVLVGFGATSLSMPPRAIATVSATLSAVTFEQCARAAQAAAAASDAASARRSAVSILS